MAHILQINKDIFYVKEKLLRAMINCIEMSIVLRQMIYNAKMKHENYKVIKIFRTYFVF